VSTTKSIKLSLSNTVINCRIIGDGNQNAICFHGFGQDGSVFQPILQSQPDLTLYSIDLPFHGRSTVQDPTKSLTPAQVGALAEQLLIQCKIDEFAILAFSIGARLVLPIVDRFGSRVTSIALISPDGIAPNFWYQVATKYRASRFVFKLIMQNFHTVHSANKLFRVMRLIDSEKNVTVERAVSSAKQAERVYYCWTYLRKLTLNIQKVSELAMGHNFCVKVIAGKYDKIIPAIKLEKAVGGLRNVDYVELSAGHFDLISRFAEV